jgi:hypothetical protein
LTVPVDLETSAYLSEFESASIIFGVATLAIPGPPFMPTVYGTRWLHVTETAAVAFAAE